MKNIFSSASGLIMIVIDLLFAVWAGVGKVWYIYLFNFVLLFIASGIINSSYIQGLARGMSYIYLFGIKGILKALKINIPTIIFMILAYFITTFVFTTPIQYYLFFTISIVISTIVAFVDKHFEIAIEKTKTLENITDN